MLTKRQFHSMNGIICFICSIWWICRCFIAPISFFRIKSQTVQVLCRKEGKTHLRGKQLASGEAKDHIFEFGHGETEIDFTGLTRSSCRAILPKGVNKFLFKQTTRQWQWQWHIRTRSPVMPVNLALWAHYTWERRKRWDQVSISAKLDDPVVPFGPHGPSGTSWTSWTSSRMASSSITCWVIERGWEPKIHCVSDCISHLHHPSLSLFQFQWMIEKMISRHKKRHDGNGPDRVIECILTHKCHKYHKFNQWRFQNLMMNQTRTLQMWTLHHHQLDHQHQLSHDPWEKESVGTVQRPARLQVVCSGSDKMTRSYLAHWVEQTWQACAALNSRILFLIKGYKIHRFSLEIEERQQQGRVVVVLLHRLPLRVVSPGYFILWCWVRVDHYGAREVSSLVLVVDSGPIDSWILWELVWHWQWQWQWHIRMRSPRNVNLALRTRVERSWPQQKESVKVVEILHMRQGVQSRPVTR